jgi:hypothetical protein
VIAYVSKRESRKALFLDGGDQIGFFLIDPVWTFRELFPEALT